MKLFKEKNINEYFKVIFEKVKLDIENMNEEKFMQYNPNELAKIKSDASKLNHFQIDLENRTSNVVMVLIPGKRFPITYDVTRGQSYPCARIDYSYNLPKESELLSFQPTGFQISQQIEASINEDKLILHYQTLYGNENLTEAEKIKVNNAMILLHEEINRIVEYINLDIDIFNGKIDELISKLISKRRDKINKSGDQNNDLNDF